MPPKSTAQAKPVGIKTVVKKTTAAVAQKKEKALSTEEKLTIVQQKFNDSVKPLIIETAVENARIIVEGKLKNGGDIFYHNEKDLLAQKMKEEHMLAEFQSKNEQKNIQEIPTAAAGFWDPVTITLLACGGISILYAFYHFRIIRVR